jgi:hypothetical protein
VLKAKTHQSLQAMTGLGALGHEKLGNVSSLVYTRFSLSWLIFLHVENLNHQEADM